MVTSLKVEKWKVLHEQLRAIVRRRAILDAEEARCLREAWAMQLWQELGYVHMGEYLEREMGYGPQVGAERLRVARELGALPRMEAWLTDGALSYSAVRELTRIATGETEEAWLDEARGKNLRQIEAMIAGRKRGDRPSDPTTPELVNRIVRLELSPPAFALLRQTQAAMADEQGGRLDDSAFIEALCRRALEGAATSERPAHQIAFTVCESCKRGWQNGAGGEIEVAPAVIERAGCDAEWIGSLDAEQPARVTGTVTPRLRRQVFARDQHRCTVPGCRSARNLDVHHIQFQRDGSGHEMSNTTVLCSGHHQQLHDGAMSIRGTAPDKLTFTWARGPETAPQAASDAKRTSATEVPVSGQMAAGGQLAAGGQMAVIGPMAVGGPVPISGPVAVGGPVAESGPMAVSGPVAVGPMPVSGPMPVGPMPVSTPVRGAASVAETSDRDRDAREVLAASGYEARAARVAVESARSHVGAEASLEVLLREAFRRCGRPRGG